MITFLFGGLIVGGAAGYAKTRYFSSIEATKAIKVLAEATEEKDEILKKHGTWQESSRKRLKDWGMENQEHLDTFNKRGVLLETKLKKWDDKNGQFNGQNNKILEAMKNLKEERDLFLEKTFSALEKSSGIVRDDMLKQLKSDFDSRFSLDYDRYLNKYDTYAEDMAPKRARGILTGVMNRYSEPSSVDRFPNFITIPYDKVKGRIIGKEGRNIAYFEKKADVSVIFNDGDPNTLTVSCFHLLRREIALRALTKLCREKSIDEAIIDHAIERARYEVDKELLKIGLKMAKIIELPKQYQKEKLLKLIGRLKYRTSYGQNILYHSLEVAYFCAMLASEIGADVEVARYAGFFHDLGKAIDQDDGIDDPHDLLSKKILEEFDFPWEIVHAAWVHHDAEPAETVEAVLVKIADTLSASRPGARAESSDDYYSRIQALEGLALDTEGVEKVLTMSGGREIRTFVDTKAVSDSDMKKIAEGLAGRIEDTLSYPGKVRVNVIRQFWAKRKANDPKASKK